MSAIKTRKRKKTHDDLFVEVGSVIGDVYKVLSKKGGLLHSLMATTRQKRKKRSKRRK